MSSEDHWVVKNFATGALITKVKCQFAGHSPMYGLQMVIGRAVEMCLTDGAESAKVVPATGTKIYVLASPGETIDSYTITKEQS